MDIIENALIDLAHSNKTRDNASFLKTIRIRARGELDDIQEFVWHIKTKLNTGPIEVRKINEDSYGIRAQNKNEVKVEDVNFFSIGSDCNVNVEKVFW